MKKVLIRAGMFMVVALPVLIASCLDSGPEIPSYQEQLEKDVAFIDSYLATNNITADTDPSGLRYVVHRATAGVQPTVDSCVTVNYQGVFMSNGQVFDSGSNISFPVKNVIDGWRIGIPLLHEGDSATLYIPSGLAYGYYGFPPTIPSNANLIFHVGLKKVAKTYNTTTRSCN
ncbi:MAG: FKBP-type peptidyl-prolyl cis-trans isomerase [Bacteroidota bacterium]